MSDWLIPLKPACKSEMPLWKDGGISRVEVDMYFYHGLKDGDFMETLLSHACDKRSIYTEKACIKSKLPELYRPLMVDKGYLTVKQIMSYGGLSKDQVNSAMSCALIPLGFVERTDGTIPKYRWIDEVEC